MSWMNYFDEIFLINLPTRVDKLMKSSDQFRKYGIKFKVVKAISDVDGAKGLYMTMYFLFKECLRRRLTRILVFEDDFKFLFDPTELMEACIKQLPITWRQFYLGANLPKPHLVSKYSNNLLLTKRALSSHAVAYSMEMMEMIVSLPMQHPIDLQVANFLHPNGEIYCAYPLLATQMTGSSDIKNGAQVDQTDFIDRRYQEVINHLNKQQ